MVNDAAPVPAPGETEEARTRRALLHMLEDLHHERELLGRAHRGWLDTIDAIDTPLAVIDGALLVVRANRAYAQRAGRDFRSLTGRPFWECFPRLAAAPAAVPGQFELDTGEIFATRSYPMGEADGQGPLWLHLFDDVTAARRSERQARAVRDVASSAHILDGDIEAVARQMTEIAAQVAGVARANVWLFNEAEDELRCIDLFEAPAGRHSSGMVLREHEYRNEFAALKSMPYVDASEPLSDPRTSSYVETYIKPLGITSMLDTVVAVAGRHIGLLCLEHVGRAHRWRPDEIAFAAHLADKIAVTLSNRLARQAAQDLRDSELRYRTMFETAPLGVSESSLTGQYLSANPRLCEITGYSGDELRQRSFRDITHPDDLARDGAALAAMLAGSVPAYATEKRYLRKDGQAVWVSVNVKPVRDDKGAILRLLTMVEDITPRREQEAAIRALARFPAESPYPVMRISAAGCLLFANPASLPLQVACGAQCGSMVNEEFSRLVRDSLANGKIAEAELQHGGRLYAVTAAPVASEGYANLYGLDITERRQAQQSLEQRERYYRKLIEGASDAFFVVDEAGMLRYRSESAMRLTGYGTEEVLGKPMTQFVSPESLPQVRQALADGLARPGETAKAEFTMRRKDGQTITLEATGRNLLQDPDVRGIVITARDITGRLEAERRLRHLNRTLRTLSAGNIALVRATDEDGLLREMARLLVEVGGYALAWIGYAADTPDKLVEPKACLNIDAALLRESRLSWGDNGRGQGVMARAIRSSQPQIISDVASDPSFAPWRALVQDKGVRAVIGLPLRFTKAERPFGAIGIGAVDPEAFNAEEVQLLEELAGDVAYGIANLRARAERDAGAAHLRRSLESTIGAIAGTMEMRDPYTAGHQRRVATLATAIAAEMGLPAHDIEGIHFGALIHDLGKIQVPSEILAKPTRLTRLEFELIKTHPQAGYDIIKGVEFPWPVALMVRQHHERLDGTGYPQGLKGDAICPEARILAVADVVEAMSSHRPYRAGLGLDAALEEIRLRRGTWFDEAAVDACLRLFREKQFSFDQAEGAGAESNFDRDNRNPGPQRS